MFSFLKEKLKSAVGAFSKKVEESKEEIVEEAPAIKKPVKKQEKAPSKKEPTKKEKTPPKKSASPAKKAVPQETPRKSDEKKAKEEPKKSPSTTPSKPAEKKGFFSRMFGLGKKDETPLEEETQESAPAEELSEQTADTTETAEVEVDTKNLEESAEEPSEASEEESEEEPTESDEEESEAEEEAPEEETPEPATKEEEEPKKGFFARLGEKIVSKKVSPQEFEDMFWELEVGLLENNVAVEVIEKIKKDLSAELVDKPIRRGQIEETIVSALRKSISTLFIHKQIDLLKLAKEAKSQNRPLVVCLVGINGSGKTTSIAKLTHYLKNNGLEVVISASDTFRAAAIDQLQLHADKLGVKLIKHDYGSDPAAVAFDAIKHAESKGKDVVLIDTAGRMQSNVNLMEEMQKIVRVAKPDIKIFIGESITGNDCVEQARTFDDAVGIDGIILSKADIDEKGGAAISVSYVTKKPILFLGVGQEYEDLKPFDPKLVMEGLGF